MHGMLEPPKHAGDKRKRDSPTDAQLAQRAAEQDSINVHPSSASPNRLPVFLWQQSALLPVRSAGDGVQAASPETSQTVRDSGAHDPDQGNSLAARLAHIAVKMSNCRTVELSNCRTDPLTPFPP